MLCGCHACASLDRGAVKDAFSGRKYNTVTLDKMKKKKDKRD